MLLGEITLLLSLCCERMYKSRKNVQVHWEKWPVRCCVHDVVHVSSR